MKTDEEARYAIEKAHQHEQAFAEFLRGFGLRVAELSHGFRKSLADVTDYAHDIDLRIEGYRCQYKHRSAWLEVFQHFGSRPFVDEQVKADRTPVDFYILRFCDGVIVVPYTPAAWIAEQYWDTKDRARKWFYTVDPTDGIPLEAWIESLGS